jgi:hypothetical protein
MDTYDLLKTDKGTFNLNATSDNYKTVMGKIKAKKFKNVTLTVEDGYIVDVK